MHKTLPNTMILDELLNSLDLELLRKQHKTLLHAYSLASTDEVELDVDHLDGLENFISELLFILTYGKK